MLCLLNVSVFYSHYQAHEYSQMSISWGFYYFTSNLSWCWAHSVLLLSVWQPVLFFTTVQQDSTELSYLHFFISPPCFHALIVSPSVRIRPGSVSGCSENGNAKCCFCGPNVGLFLLSEVRGMNSRWIRKLTVAVWMGTCFVREKYLF